MTSHPSESENATSLLNVNIVNHAVRLLLIVILATVASALHAPHLISISACSTMSHLHHIFSLLEAMVDVDRATRVAPPPTPEMAMSLLDMIKKRCLDGNWDDVTPR